MTRRIAPDAHSIGDRPGVLTARRGWARQSATPSALGADPVHDAVRP